MSQDIFNQRIARINNQNGYGRAQMTQGEGTATSMFSSRPVESDTPTARRNIKPMLLGAVLEPDPDTAPTLSADDVIELAPPAQGCAFQRRCPRKLGGICDTDTPPWRVDHATGHAIRCHIDRSAL